MTSVETPPIEHAATSPGDGTGRAGAAAPGSGAPRSAPRRWRRPSAHGWITGGIGLGTLVLFCWNLSSVGLANSYYTAAVKSATLSWKAFFFGSIDPGNFITVDKPPAALWLQALSARLLGFSSFSMLLPEALCGVASVLLLHRMVRRWLGDWPAHLAALALAVTPVAALMFRYNNPDALLTLLCVGAAAALWTALERGRTRWLVLSAALVGLAFQTKMLQAFLILPAFIAVYLWAGPPKLGKRLLQLTAALVSLVVSAGWWVAIVALWPAASRPYIGSTDDNSIISLVVGYNGLGRIFGEGNGPGGASGPAGGGGMGNGFGGTTGILRMFNDANGGQISWLLPLAGLALLAGLWLTRRESRRSLARAGWVLWGGWALVSLVTFSLSSGIYHQYYTVQVAPAVAALAGAGGVTLWRLGRHHRALRWVLPVSVIGTAAWAAVLLARTSGYHTWLRPAIVIGAALAASLLWVGDQLRRKAVVLAGAAVATATLLAGPTAYTITTALHPQQGSIVQAGPTSAGIGMGGPGGPGASATVDQALIDYLESHRGDATYLVAAFGSQSSAPIIIATGEPVITIGGFSGSDPAPTLEEFQRLVADGEVRFVLVGGMGGGPGGRGGSGISSWVTSNGTAVSGLSTSAGTLYDVSGVVTS